MKIKFVVCFVLCICVSLAACGEKEEEKKNTDPIQESENKNDDNKKESVSEEKDVVDNTDENEQIFINLYYVEDETGNIVIKPVEIVKLDKQYIWEELQNSGILSQECQLSSMVIDDNKRITLDVNHSFGERLRSMGTAGENEIVTCVVNTYIDAFQADAVMITEDGTNIGTGHTSYDGFIKKQ